jgi:hypothetical protein
LRCFELYRGQQVNCIDEGWFDFMIPFEYSQLERVCWIERELLSGCLVIVNLNTVINYHGSCNTIMCLILFGDGDDGIRVAINSFIVTIC